MMVRVRHISPATFGFVVLCFLLPFVTLSCPGGSFTFSGVQMATGTTIEEPGLFGPGTKREIDGEPLALLAALCAVLGLLLALGPSAILRVCAAGAGAVGAVLLLALKSKIDGDLARQGGGMIAISYGLGYWLAFLGFVAAAAASLLLTKGKVVLSETSRQEALQESPEPDNPAG